MKYSLQPTALCRNRHKTDAHCRLLPRCRTCGRVLAFNWGTGLCFDCEQQFKATTAAESALSTRRCQHCGEILQSFFADRTCTRCAAVHNVVGGAL